MKSILRSIARSAAARSSTRSQSNTILCRASISPCTNLTRSYATKLIPRPDPKDLLDPHISKSVANPEPPTAFPSSSSSSSASSSTSPSSSTSNPPSPANFSYTNILSDTIPPGSKIVTGVWGSSFKINGSQVMHGPIVVLNNTVLSWLVPQFGVGGPDEVDEETVKKEKKHKIHDDPASIWFGWTTDMLKAFELVHPRPEILVIGSGATLEMLPQFLRTHLHSLGMQVEVMASKNAASTYNLLFQEGRRPAVALLPLLPANRNGGLLVEISTDKSEALNRHKIKS